MSNKLIVIGISGVTCSGKTSTAASLNNILPNSKLFVQDDYYLEPDDPRHIWIQELNHANWDVITSLDMEKLHSDILEHIQRNNFKVIEQNKSENHSVGLMLEDKSRQILHNIQTSNLHVIIVEGFSIFNYKPMLPVFDMKYYYILDKEECYRRRQTRVYEPPDCPGYFEKCVWPEHLSQKQEVLDTVDSVTVFDENTKDVVAKILSDISEYLLDSH